MRTAYLRALHELAEKDENVYALISDNGAIVYDGYRRDFPDQYLNLGISEANMLGMAAGMDSRGKVPFAYTIGAFLAYRAYEFIRNDICLQNMNVKIVGTGAGEVYSALGPTNHATEDLGGLRALPNLTILSPASPKEAYQATLAAYRHEGPVYLRLGTNREPEIYGQKGILELSGLSDQTEQGCGTGNLSKGLCFELGKAIELRSGSDITIVATGRIVKDALDVAEELEKGNAHASVLNIHTVKPFDSLCIRKAVDETGRIITLEDHNVIGGLGSTVAEAIAEYGKPVRFKRIGLEGFSHGYGTYEEVKEANGIGRAVVLRTAHELLKD